MKAVCSVLTVILISVLKAEQKCSLKHEFKIYDFVVVGGGTAGSVIASRLSEDSDFTVLLLEAGGKPPIISRIPMLTPLMLNTEVDWNYTTVPQKYACLSEPEQKSQWPRGKMLGGSSSLNFMNFYRGNKHDFELWEKSGVKGWNWDQVLSYYLKIENSHLNDVNEEIHSKSGNIPITNPGKNHPFLVSFMNALNEMGYIQRDPNDGIQTGYSLATLNVYNNERRTPFTNYLRPVMNCRHNLKVKTFAFVEKVLFNNEKKAIGVVYSHKNCRYTVIVRNEVIIAAGAINTPQLLMLSGIGPKDHLKSMNIKVIADLPVGDNLHDHLYVSLMFSKPYEPIYTNEALDEALRNGSGRLTDYSVANAFVNTKFSKNVNHPDIQIMTPSWTFPSSPASELLYGTYAVLTRPKSRGLIRLLSTDPHQHPLIDPKYLTVEEDVKVLAEGVKLLYNVTKIMAKSDFEFRREEVSVSACDEYKKSDDQFWYCFVRQMSRTVFHPCGTCKMGSKSDSLAVVDNELKVIGVKGVRVADASVMPTIVAPNLQATVMMIAERAADFIKFKYKNFCKKMNLKQILFKTISCSLCE